MKKTAKKKTRKTKTVPLPRPKPIVPMLPFRFFWNPLNWLLEREDYRLRCEQIWGHE
ncbi:hypothetical protein HF908_11195 [Ralstonia pseudosolanacearum]|uniref:hypothetical protein n=1 Tax=Ralstonia pseudosolanacearum TaxID=1310165 RepID=UPI0018680ED3|nr:hypothetical protein [Ralstonia pseudosolanacearum]QOK91992.1 hypothetical protein HF908_11195 [Ralstonia pseudosolanacearum]